MKISLILTLFVLFLLSGCSKPTLIYKVVEEVGGCDRDFCSVKFTDGTYGKANPAKGEAMKGAGVYVYQ